MKTLRLSATLVLLGALTAGVASTTDEQIVAIKTAATTQERVTLMNEFKAQLSTLSADERASAIDQLRATMKGSGEQTPVQVRVRERVRTNQVEGDDAMLRNQNMHQHQTVTQGKGKGVGGSNSSGNK